MTSRSSTNTQFDPLHQWFGIAAEHQPPNHYVLLGVDLYEGNQFVIDNAVEQRATFLQDITDGPNIAAAQAILNSVAAARVCLTDPGLKHKYDAALKAHLESSTTRSTAFEFTIENSKRPRRKQQTIDGKTALLFATASVLCVALIAGVAVFKFGGQPATQTIADQETVESVIERKNLVTKHAVDRSTNSVSRGSEEQTGLKPPVLFWDFESETPGIGAGPRKVANTERPGLTGDGWSGKCASFDGKNDALGIGQGIVKAAEGSISFRVRIPSQQDGGTAIVLSSNYAKTNPSLRLNVRAILNGKTAKLVATCNSRGTSTAISRSHPNCALDQWVHLVITWKATGRAHFYVEGIAISKTGSQQQKTADPRNIIFGHKRSTPPNFTKMDLDDVRIYDYQLSAIEVSTLHAQGKSR